MSSSQPAQSSTPISILSNGEQAPPPTRNGTIKPGSSTKAQEPPTPSYKLPKVDTNLVWPSPIGVKPRGPNDDNLIVFRRAVGINSSDVGIPSANSKSAGTLEEGRKSATGIYLCVLQEQRRRKWQHFALSSLLNLSHFAQIVIGATLTALGPSAGKYTVVITALGAVNTVLAGVLALLKGQGLPERLHKDEMYAYFIAFKLVLRLHSKGYMLTLMSILGSLGSYKTGSRRLRRSWLQASSDGTERRWE